MDTEKSDAALLEVARHPRHLGAEIGFFSVFHTWNPKARASPLCPLRRPRWRAVPRSHSLDSITRSLLSPIQLLRRVFRGKFVAGLNSAFQHNQLRFSGDLTLLAQPKIFASWLRPLFRKDWVVYSKPPFGGREYVLQYLGRYTHPVAISNHRLVPLTDQKVTFRWRDSADNNQHKLLTLSLDEFLRRFLLRLFGRTTKYVIPGQLSRPGPSGHLGEIHFLVVRKRGSLGLVRFALVLHGDFACPPNHERTTEIRHPILKLARTLDGLEDDLQFGSHEIPTRADWGLPPEERVPSTPSFCFAMNW